MSMTPPDTGSPDDHDAMAMDYVLGSTTIFERRAAEALLARDADFRAAVAQWQAVLSPLDEDTAPITPPPAVWAAITAQVQPAPPMALAAKSAAPPQPRAMVPWPALGIVGAVLAAIAAAVLLL